jgi:hypothetical protein
MRGERSQKRRGCHPEYRIITTRTPTHRWTGLCVWRLRKGLRLFPKDILQMDRTAANRPAEMHRTHRPGEVGVGLCLGRGIVQPHQQSAYCSMVHYTHRARARCGAPHRARHGLRHIKECWRAADAAGVGCEPSVTCGVALASPVYGARGGAERGARRKPWVGRRAQRGWAYRQSSRGHPLDACRAYTKRGTVGFVRGTPQPVTPVEGDGS